MSLPICITYFQENNITALNIIVLPSSSSSRCLGPCLALCPDYTFVLEDELGVCGCVLGVLDVRSFAKRCQASWMPAMRDKYPSKSAHHNTQVRRKDGPAVSSCLRKTICWCWLPLKCIVIVSEPVFSLVCQHCGDVHTPTFTTCFIGQVSPAVTRQHSPVLLRDTGAE